MFEDGTVVGGTAPLSLLDYGSLGVALACAGTALGLGRPIKRLKAVGVEVPG
ncbi:hypothetical protein [Jiangella ureilytica]|uniref:hypothetical protein n=1 Tax=Jiangella ureilytica TaxID=2530374 RepID=UPI00193E7110|nr:hypothetical protein [Jiangella ureilytica]